jgi:hypothetical protein
MKLFSSKASYITKQDGFLHYSKLKIDIEDSYILYYKGYTERRAIKHLEKNIKELMKDCNKMLTDLRVYKDSLDQQKIF